MTKTKMKALLVFVTLIIGCSHTATIPPGFCTPNDIVLVVDGSESVGIDNFNILKSQMVDFVRELPVTPDGIRVGVVLYSSSVEASYKISMTGDEATLVSSILNLPYPGTGTLTNVGLDEGVKMLQNEGRPGVGDKLVVITDGYSNLPDRTNISAAAAKAAGIDSYALGVGAGVNVMELNAIASAPQNIRQAANFDVVLDSLRLFSRELCAGFTTPPPIPSDCNADIVFIVDSSIVSSFGNLYTEILSRIKFFLSQQPISDSAIRVGLVFTNDIQTVEIPLSGDAVSLTEQINLNQISPGGGLMLSQGLNSAINIFNGDTLNRNAPRVAVVLATTGSAGGSIPIVEANALKTLTGAPVTLVTMGVNTPFGPLYKNNELTSIASSPQDSYLDETVNTIGQRLNSIASTECQPFAGFTTPPPIPSDCNADIVFIVDSSMVSSFGNLYTEILSRIKFFLSQQPISDSAIRVGLVFTNDIQTVEIPLSGNAVSLTEQINLNQISPGGGLMLSQGLNSAINIFNGDTLNRNAPRVAVVLATTGSAGGSIPIVEANALKTLTGAPVTLVTMGVDTPFGPLYKNNELTSIASSPQDSYLGETVDTIGQRLNSIATTECQPFVPPTPECAADVVFVVDSSDYSTLQSMYTDTMAAINSFIDTQTLSNNHVRVGVVITSQTNNVRIPLTDDKTLLKNQLSLYSSPFGGAAALGQGLDSAAGIFSSDTLNRNAPRVTILVGAGQNNADFPIPPADFLKSLPGGSMNVYSFGVSTFGPLYNTDELTAIASPGNFLPLIDAKSIQNNFNAIAATECAPIVPPPPVECAADIVFVIDSSSISEFGGVYANTTAALNSFISQQTLSDTNLRVGVVFTSAALTIPLPITSDKTLLQSQLAGFASSPPAGGVTTLNSGLNAAASLFNSDSVNRNAPRVTVVLTSGTTQLGPPVAEANALQNLPGNPMTVYAVGVNNIPTTQFYSQQELEVIATSPANVINLPTASSIKQTFDDIASSECSPIQPTLPPTTTSNPAPVTNCAADIIFIVDASDITKSDNIWADFQNTLKTFVSQPFISDSATRVGIVYTNAVTNVDIPLSGDSNTLLNQINLRSTPLGGGQILGTGLNAAKSMFLNDPYNRNAPQVAIVLTAGRSQGGALPTIEANDLHTLGGSGTVSTYAVGVDTLNGQFYNPAELDVIASVPSQSLRVSDRDSLVSRFTAFNNAECRVAQIPANCNPTDIVLVVDGSASIGLQAFEELKSTLLKFAQDIPASPDGINIGVVTYSSIVNPLNNIQITGDLDALQNQILNLPYPEAGTRTDLGIQEGRNLLKFGGRPGVKKVMVVITDGFSDDVAATALQAQQARDVDLIDMYALGVGNGVADAELLNIAGYIGNVERVDNFKAIIPSFLQLSRALCFVPTTSPPPPPPTTPGPSCAADMVIVVDASDITKSGGIYVDTIETLKNFINQQIVSNTGNRIGIVLTSDNGVTKIPISGDPNFLLNELNNNPDPLGGGLLLGSGLNGAVELFNSDAINRNVPRVTVVLTAGTSRGGALPFVESGTLKNLQGGDPMVVYAAGITSPNGALYNPTELQLIATNTGYVREPLSTNNILSYLTNVQSAECEIVPDLKSCNPRDIVLVVDGSQSIGNASFELLKSKLVDFTRQLAISPVGANVGIVLYSTTVDSTGIIPINSDPIALEAAINALPYPEQGTNTHLGIIEGNNLLKNSPRFGADKVMVVITDGYSDDPTSTENAASVVQAEGVNMYSIGVGNGVYDPELYDIASSPNNVQKISTFDAITLPFARVARAICETPCPVDVVFVVDSSDVTNSGQVYEDFVNSIRAFVLQQSISNIGTRVGIVFTNENAGETVQVPLSGDRNYVINQLDINNAPLGDGLNLGNGLNAAANIFRTNTLNRNAHRLAFVLTAGRSKSGFVPTAEALNLKNIPVTVAAFGLPTPSGVLYSQTELRNIATSPFGTVYEQNDYSSLPFIYKSLVDTACSSGAPPPPIATPPPTTPIPVCNPRDIVLVVDGSASIGVTNFNTLKNNLIQFVNGLPVTPNDVNVGVVTYSSDVNPIGQIPLTGDPNALTNAINNLPYPEAGTRTDLGINAGITALNNGRPGEDKIMIVITDGYSDIPSATKQAADNAKAAGITVYAVGVGGIDAVELNEIATGPLYVEQTADFGSVLQSLTLLSRTLCDPPTTTPAQACVNPVDVVFLLDGSGSVKADNFTIMKEKLAASMPNFNVAPGIVNVGVVVYSAVVGDTITITDDSNQLQSDILGLNFPNKNTYTNLGIDRAQNMLVNDGRAGVPNVLVVITDGESTEPALTQDSATAAKAAGTDIHVIGVGSGYSRPELDGMASDLSQVTIADKFDIISITLEQLVDDICN